MKRLILILVVLLVALPAAAFTAAHVLLDADALRLRAAEAVRRATGRELVIAGRIQLAWSLTPTIKARDVSLLNPPGMSRPATAHADRVSVQVALLPLLERRVELRRVVLETPDILLERDHEGRPNWTANRPEPANPAPQAAPSNDRRFAVALGAVEVRDARIVWHGGGVPIEAAAHQIAYAPETGRLAGEAVVNGVKMSLSGAAPAAAPFDINLTGGGLAIKLAGTPTDAAATLRAPDLATLGALLGRPLPPIRDVKLSATLTQSGPHGLAAEGGPWEFGSTARLQSFKLSAPSLGEPVEARAVLLVGQLPVAVAVNAASLSALLGPGPIPVQFLAAASDATVTGQGSVANWRGEGPAVTLSARVPDLGKLGAAAGFALPGLRDAALDARITSAPGAILLRGIRFTSSGGDLGGDLAVGLGSRPNLRGSLVSQRLFLDEWASHEPTAAPAPPAPANPAPAAPPPPPDRVIPDRPLPVAALRAADADLHLGVAEARWRGASLRGVDARVLLADGKMRLDPASAQTPGGAIHLQLQADAAAAPPTLAMTALAPGLAAGPILTALGAPEPASGTLDLDLQMQGSGATTRALAATLTGHLGLALVDADIDNRWLEQIFADLLRAAKLPIGGGGVSRVRCAALRADAAAGEVQIRTLALDSTRLRLDGEGSLNLTDETVDLHLRPLLRLGTSLSLPVRVAGPLRAPKFALDPGAIAPGRVGIMIGGPSPPDFCPAALTSARNGAAGPAPTTPEPPSRPARPADLLRGLLR